MKKLTIVVPVLGQHEMVRVMLRHLLQNIEDTRTSIVIVDNGDDFAWHGDDRVQVMRPDGGNIGVYPVFKWGFDNVVGDVLAFFHSDLIVDEKGFDARILRAFEGDPKLGLVGFVGSNEIDSAGGRGSGTTSNFQGKGYFPVRGDGFAPDVGWRGSPAEAHGMRNAGLSNAAVVDGCAMVILREAWKRIGCREDFPPHHFYDRLISTQMIEAGLGVAVLGIACDHISGQTVSKEDRYNGMAEQWAREHISPERFVGNPPHWSWDQTVYQEAERMWLGEYRDQKHIVPIRV